MADHTGNPSISVITATFNAAQHLPRLISTLKAQSDSAFEWIVCDGASMDATLSILKAEGSLVSVLVSAPDHGVYHALNKALSLATGSYYLVVGADDELDLGAIARYRQCALSTGADIVSAPVWSGAHLQSPRATLSWFRSEPPLVSAHSVGALIRRSLHDELGLYDRRFPIAADTYFLLKAWQAKKEFANLKEPAGRFGTAGLSSANLLASLSESMQAHARVRGAWAWQFTLFVLRVLKNHRRIGRQMNAEVKH